MKTSQPSLLKLETSGLIQLKLLEPEIEYFFKHTLVQDAAYSSILKSDRKAIHIFVGATLESIYADRLVEQAATLGYHFAEGGDSVKAFYYFKIAGDAAAKQYALEEALSHFTHAIAIQANALVHILRGQIYSTLGNFDKAREDYEKALSIAKLENDKETEANSLLELGALWSEKDYQHTGEYYQLAQAIALESENLLLQANTLNRIANWHLNIDDPASAVSYHEQALEIFMKLEDENGISETHDLLGMANALGTDFVQSSFHYNKAIPLFKKLGKLHLLSSSLTTLQFSAPTIQSDIAVCISTPRESLRLGLESLSICRSIHWQAGESYALWVLEQVACYLGEYNDALEYIQAALGIADSIHHDQWILASHLGMGDWHHSLLNYQAAADEFKTALAIAKQIGSIHWQRVTGGLLATLYIKLGLLNDARTLISELSPSQSEINSLGQRQIWFALVDLHLAESNPSMAIELLDLIASTTPNYLKDGAIVIRHKMTRGQALLANGQNVEAEGEIRNLILRLEQYEAAPMQWRAHVLLANILDRSGKAIDAREERVKAGTIVENLLMKIPIKNRHEFTIRAKEHGVISGL